MVDEFVLAYPNIEDLFLESTTMVAFRRNDTVISDKESLSAIKFGHLTSLTLQGFDLNNGASLISVIILLPINFITFTFHALHFRLQLCAPNWRVFT